MSIPCSRISHNMSIEGNKRTHETPQEVYDRIRQYVEAVPFGSAEYQAISDYKELDRHAP